MNSEKITLELQPRDTLGKAVKQLRRDGIVPGVIHDHGKPSIHVQAEYQTLYKVYAKAGKHHPVNVTVGGKRYVTIIKAVTFDPRYNNLTHITFGAVTATEKVEAEVPVHAVYAEGNDVSPAERNSSLIVLAQTTTVAIKAIATDLPDELTYDGEKLVEVGDQVTVADLKLPHGVELDIEPEHVIATVFEPSALAAANDEAGGDAEAGDEDNVESEHESGAEEGTQADEIRPGGKMENEDKQQGRNPEKQ